ncbi:MAG TPA: DUF2877 domain-containing protein [Nocardioides sp.]|nr:DUF2877 domain-containing protein [Nocardioides sp.]
MTSGDHDRRGAGPVRLSGAASTLLGPLAGRRRLRLTEVARTRLTVHYETGVPAVPVLCVALPGAVRLPATLLSSRLPAPSAHDGATPTSIAVTRWWRPARPPRLAVPAPAVLERLPEPPYDVLDPLALVGRGEGLTPQGDDVLAAALVTARATGDPRLAGWCARTRLALATRRTTAVSRGLLHHALEGWATPELVDVLVALGGADADTVDRAVQRLLAVGRTSGAALLDGVALTLTTRHLPTGGPPRPVHEGAA